MTQPMTLALANGSRIAEYRIERLLGEGGFGLTYLATDEHLHKRVAIKEYLPIDFAMRGANAQVLPRTESSRNDFAWGLEAFINEARILAKFHNPYIVQVFRYFEANGTAYIVMEYVEGRTLRATVNDLGELQEAEILAVLLPVMDGLMDVHDAGILHRDIKPENILIRDDGKPVLIDFGAARQALGSKSRSITTVITPGYVPIEQYSTKGNVGPWSDIYSLAAVAYFCLTRKRPEEASDRALEDHLLPARDAANGLASPAFLNAIDRGLSVSPQDRPQNLEDWVKALRGDKEQVTKTVDSTPPPTLTPTPTKVVPEPTNEPPPKPSPAPNPAAAPAVERTSNRRGLIILLGLLLIVLGGFMAQQALLKFQGPDAPDDTTAGADSNIPSTPDTSADADPETNADAGTDSDVPEPEQPETSNGDGESEGDAVALEPEQPPEPEPEPEPLPEEDTTFRLTVITDPDGAHFVLYGDPRRYEDGIELTNGSYRLKISMPGYRTVEITVESSGEDVVREVTLVREITPQEQALFDAAKSSRSVADLQAYLNQYPQGSYADRVRSWLAEAQEREQQASEEQLRARAKEAVRAWRDCQPVPWKQTPTNGVAVFDIPGATSGSFRIRVGRTTLPASQISQIGSGSPLRELCSSATCYAVTAPFGETPYTVTQGRQNERGQACFYYPDERNHRYRVDF
ncbi:protein kinase domain-containing protein [Marinobacter zhejiangensis]|uniref:Serine/threonine protein kinase n=1 Tax=Marinobacter zhejiangensis TaxID=488535 RepID=A0A1I4SG93_9GAMM|nr:protein kinase [Marinobacter zhejiangensis]SFM63313.1 Serine/threonine protein kinase [Marinobacter zhejiangensis]